LISLPDIFTKPTLLTENNVIECIPALIRGYHIYKTSQSYNIIIYYFLFKLLSDKHIRILGRYTYRVKCKLCIQFILLFLTDSEFIINYLSSYQ